MPLLKTAFKDRFTALRRHLSPAQRELLVLRVDRRMSWDEVADVLTVDGQRPLVNTLTVQFKRLKAKLYRLAEQEGLLERLET